jgi:hypothetical protein
MYKYLTAGQEDCVLVIYRNTRPGKIDLDNRRYGETGRGGQTQLDADRKWWNVAPDRRPHLKGMVIVVNGTVTRIYGVDPNGTWEPDDRDYVSIPLTGPVKDNLQVAEKFPTLGIRLGDHRPHVRGKIREYLPL